MGQVAASLLHVRLDGPGHGHPEPPSSGDEPPRPLIPRGEGPRLLLQSLQGMEGPRRLHTPLEGGVLSLRLDRHSLH